MKLSGIIVGALLLLAPVAASAQYAPYGGMNGSYGYTGYGYQQQGYSNYGYGYGTQNYGAYLNINPYVTNYMGGNQYGYNSYNPSNQYGNGYGNYGYGSGYGQQQYQTQGVYGVLPNGMTYYNSGYPKQNCYYSSYYYVCQ